MCIRDRYVNNIKGGLFKGLNYNVGFYFDRNRNKVTKFGADEISGHYLRQEGLPYNSYYMLDCIGIFRDEDDEMCIRDSGCRRSDSFSGCLQSGLHPHASRSSQ